MVSSLGILIFCGVALAAPLTTEVKTNATAYMEWLLDVSFSADQKHEYHRILSDTWKSGNQGAIAAVTSMAGAYEKLGALGEAERLEKRAKVQTEFVKLLRTAGDKDSRWLLALYESAHTANPAPTSGTGGGNLVGRWTNGRISSIQYQNAYTGVSAPTNGSSFAYEFRADGTYSFTGLMQSVMYNCTTAMFSNESGVYTVNGDTVSLRPESNPYKVTNNCAPSSNRESPGKLVNRTYRFRMVQESGGPLLEFTAADGGVQKFQRSR